MSWTKRQIVTAAFEEIGLGPFAYEIQPEDFLTGLRRLDLMLMQWSGGGAALGYPASYSQDDTALDQDSNVPPDALNGVVAGLAVLLAPGYGKQAAADTKVAAAAGKSLLMRKSVQVLSRVADLTKVPAGQGHKLRKQINLRNTDTEATPDERIV